MFTTKFFSALAVVALLLSFSSCKKTETDVIDPNAKNSVSIEFDNRVGDQKLVLGTPAYKNAAGETFSLTTFNYFVSNVSLKNENGTVITFPNQYFLVRQADTKTLTINLANVPAGNYSELSFVMGVDSLKSISGAGERMGVLDPTSYGTDGMYWSWNSGYIFTKVEGTSTAVPTSVSPNQTFALHIGGYGGGWNGGAKTVNNLRTVTLPMTNRATVRSDIAPEIHLFVDAKQLFDGPTKISLATTNSVHSPAAAIPLADNARTMFQVDHVHNDKQ